MEFSQVVVLSTQSASSGGGCMCHGIQVFFGECQVHNTSGVLYQCNLQMLELLFHSEHLFEHYQLQLLEYQSIHLSLHQYFEEHDLKVYHSHSEYSDLHKGMIRDLQKFYFQVQLGPCFH